MDSIYEVPYAELKRRNVKALLFDIDNTLAAFDDPEPSERIIAHFKHLAGLGFSICLLSNNGEERVKRFNEKLNVCAVHKAGKPKQKAVRKALAQLGTRASETAMIGDQVFTDVWCGKNSGLYTVLVKPLTNRDEATVAWKRFFEKIVLYFYHKQAQKRL